MSYSQHQHIQSKIFSPDNWEHLLRHLHHWRFTGQRIVFTNGCFDILHAGHTDYLARASDLGNKLLVGLNTDSSVQRLKGTRRPVNPEKARADVLASLSFVDAVVLFDETTPENLIRRVQPDILVKGDDYQNREIAGADFVRSQKGKVVTLPLLEGFSTTSLIKKIQKLK
ncbi:MAG: D-glycero-beta-D-manno-heptose 1-phosphate adenylyltransferase [Bacteroidales bacterium]